MWGWKPCGMGDSADDEARVSAVDPRQGVVEADRGSAGDAGGQVAVYAFIWATGRVVPLAWTPVPVPMMRVAALSG
jgi:hypothetical protein